MTSLLRAVSMLPLGVARFLGWLIGWICWALRTNEARVTEKNLEMCFPHMPVKERRNMVRRRMTEWGKTFFELPTVWGHDKEWLLSKIKSVTNVEAYEQAKKNGKGVIILAPHLGNWEVVGLYCSMGEGITSMFAPSGRDALDQWVRQARERFGASLVPANTRGVAALIKNLKQNGVVGILPDQVPLEGSGEFAPFFNHPAYTMTLIYNLLQRSGAILVFAAATRTRGGFHLTFLQPRDEIYSSDMGVSLTALNKSIEDCIALAPDQYQWEYKRFKKQPEGYPKPYKEKRS